MIKNSRVPLSPFNHPRKKVVELRPEPGAAGGKPETVHHVLTAQGWIQKRLGDKVTIVEWAGACGLNADYFSRLFKAHTGMSPKAWLIEARLQRATRLLAAPDATVEKTAGLCGFDCPFHFSRTFKRRFGIPPRQLPPRPPGARVCGAMKPKSRISSSKSHRYFMAGDGNPGHKHAS